MRSCNFLGSPDSDAEVRLVDKAGGVKHCWSMRSLLIDAPKCLAAGAAWLFALRQGVLWCQHQHPWEGQAVAEGHLPANVGTELAYTVVECCNALTAWTAASQCERGQCCCQGQGYPCLGFCSNSSQLPSAEFEDPNAWPRKCGSRGANARGRVHVENKGSQAMTRSCTMTRSAGCASTEANLVHGVATSLRSNVGCSEVM